MTCVWYEYGLMDVDVCGMDLLIALYLWLFFLSRHTWKKGLKQVRSSFSAYLGLLLLLHVCFVNLPFFIFAGRT